MSAVGTEGAETPPGTVTIGRLIEDMCSNDSEFAQSIGRARRKLKERVAEVEASKGEIQS